ncbi:portal protein [Nitrosovibrio sp. Nv4]|uniref:portal protein n=1 Tax=Nitrosovibrio sp. Nv4 TaxID=1945880 RepID=UPI000BC89689|nr:phage portal protein [Nitrosovibrio sp. Nv4]SOD42379.1 hypothetical protein SAMN06298226_2718 [Nitrosovibrio sp. Nv4]
MTTEAPITKDIDVSAYDKICRDIRNSPKWRLDSDTDCDYYDGAQTSVEVNQRLKDAGIPPQDSNLIKPTINAVLGLEARSRTDYKVTSDDEQQAEIAEGLSAKIKEVESESRADRAMSDAYSSMIRSGIGWVEVSREFDPLKYPYRVREVHRNEIHWDWTAREPDLSDARYLRRDKWVDREQALRMFPEESQLIGNSWNRWNTLDVYDGGDTNMARAYEIEQTWGRNQEDYLNQSSGMVRLSELWYRHYEDAHVLALPDGKSIEYVEENPYHQAAVAQGLVQVQKALLSRLRVSIWLGPHKLMDVPTPLPHSNFPYVPFWCFRKDRSRTPYGLIRDMRGPQDQIIDLDILLYEVLNSVKVEVDNDALDLSQNTYQEVAQNMSSLRSMTVLNSQRRNANGFRVTREHALAAQVFQLVQERKKRIEEVGGIYRAMLGADSSATSGVAINNLVEQGSTVLAEPNDNFRYARRMVGEQLLALIKQEMIGRPTAIAVKQGAKQKTIYFNRKLDDGTVENDIASAAVKVVLEDIPATPTFRAQQLQAMSQIVQAAPPQFQAVLYPVMLELSDVPNRHELADQLRQVAGIAESDQQMQAMQQQAQVEIQQRDQVIQGLRGELTKTQQQLSDRSRELDIKEQDLELKDKKIDVDAELKARELDINSRLKAEEIVSKHIDSAHI